MMLMRIDLVLSTRDYVIGMVLLLSSPVMFALVTFINSANYGDTGNWEYLMPVALVLRGFWFIHYLWLFQVREHQDSTLLPRAFQAVLYVDPFAWSKHAGSWTSPLVRRQSSARLQAQGQGTPARRGQPSVRFMI